MELLVALVKKKVWTVEQGLAYALQNPEPKQKVKALAELVKYLSPNLEKLALSEALAAARKIQDEEYRADALRALAEKLPRELLPEALAAAREIQDKEYRVNTLSALAEKLPPQLLPEALAAAREIQDEYSRADALSALAEKLPEVLSEALATAKSIQNEYSSANVLRALALGLSQTPSATLFPLWRDILHELSLRTRPKLLQDIKALFPVIFALGGEAATAEVARAIEDVGRWWR